MIFLETENYRETSKESNNRRKVHSPAEKKSNRNKNNVNSQKKLSPHPSPIFDI